MKRPRLFNTTKKQNFKFIQIEITCRQPLNCFQNKPLFLHVCSTSLLKTLWEKEKLLVTSNFSFSFSVFHPFKRIFIIFIKLKLSLQTLSIWKSLKFVNLGKGKMWLKWCKLSVEAEKPCGKRRKYWYLSYFAFPTKFSKSYFHWTVKSSLNGNSSKLKALADDNLNLAQKLICFCMSKNHCEKKLNY